MMFTPSRLQALLSATLAPALLLAAVSCGPPPVPPGMIQPDGDGDGFSDNQGDCNDDDATVYPGAEDFFGDGVDQDCSGADGVDVDKDGYPDRAFGGDDCNDTDPKINPGAKEIGWDEIDQNCDGVDLKDYIEIDAGEKHTCAISSKGNIQCWGDSEFDQLRAPSEGVWREIGQGALFGCAIDVDGYIECWGDDSFGQVSDAPTTAGWRNLSVGHNSACAIDSTTDLLDCWGFDYDDSLPNADPSWGIVSAYKDDVQYARVAVGQYHACAITKAKGAVDCWGMPGPSGEDWSREPVAEFNIDYLTVTAGADSTCAIKGNRGINCWGVNKFGQVNPPDDTGPYYHHDNFWKHACAIKHATDIVCWGDDKYSQVGQAPKTGSWKRVTVGKEHTCALSDVGAITCWGRNDKGQTDAP